ncbi:hypothetical protein [Actinomadura sp. HBU206391]|uniref:hypothetical protein n=1 Tax=Actinomadura sp. HBU206391 TaxID=2731692 RepID=UPI00164F0708|nr:hypothetical protein [Actinomadura sp. HBU206391]MBC6457454.1 hypothetical protein [Actinomadura sp. HBU206391]
MSEISLIGRFGFVVCASAAVAGTMPQGTAEAAPVPAAAIGRSALFDSGDNDVDDNVSRVSGKKNSVTANSPTKNQGAQHNSSNNNGRNITFQYALCRRVKNCKISQRVITRRRFVGFSGPPLTSMERFASRSGFRFFWDDTRATTIKNPSMMSLSVENP